MHVARDGEPVPFGPKRSYTWPLHIITTSI